MFAFYCDSLCGIVIMKGIIIGQFIRILVNSERRYVCPNLPSWSLGSYLNKRMLSVLSAATNLKPVYAPGCTGGKYPVFHDWITINKMWCDLAFQLMYYWQYCNLISVISGLDKLISITIWKTHFMLQISEQTVD